TAARALPLFEKARDLLAGRPGPLGAEDLYRKALAHRALGQPEEALAAFRAAVEEAPANAAWRCEFAELLRRRGRMQEAPRQRSAVLASHPQNGKARDLHETVLQEIAEGD